MNFFAAQDEPKAEALVPPRPNLGPEPWPEVTTWSDRSRWIAPSLVVLLLIIALVIRHQLRSKRKATSGLPAVDDQTEGDVSPRTRLIARSEVVREALLRAFGPGWRSKTTEEIGMHPALSDRLEPTELARLMAFLKLADRAKFAEGEAELDDDWEAWANEIVDRLEQTAGSKP